MSKNILLIEDNPDDTEITKLAFKNSKVVNEIIVARDGDEAFAYLDNTEDLPAVILLDLKLPKMDGMEVLKLIRKDHKLKRIPVVILTSSIEDYDIQEGYNLGANSYLRKPVNFDEFMKIAKQIALYWLILNEAPEHK